jgi:hypothetical protein
MSLRPFAVSALVLVVGGCGSSQVTEPVALDNVDRIELHAWRETLGPSYPLTITGGDSIATVVNFLAPNDPAWRDAEVFPGTPILAAFYSGEQVRAEYGFVETSHQQGGFLVNRASGRIRVRSATPSDIARFLAFFDLSVEIREP